jgi:hypothetical protein
VESSRLAHLIAELFDELGAASFTVTWQHDPAGLLDAAAAFLADLRLLRRVPGGVLVLPAAARYRNIKLALPVTQTGDSQLDLFSGELGRGRVANWHRCRKSCELTGKSESLSYTRFDWCCRGTLG